jgi:SAM-dependent methyltransferase
LPRAFARTVVGVPGRVHVDDDMLALWHPEHFAHYARVGESAVRNIEETLESCGLRFSDVRSCLELPSGYGRVTRHLVGRMEAARITACDVIPQAVRFCVQEFGVRGVVSRWSLRELMLPDTYDLIFVGSLMSHLPLPECRVLLRLLTRVLRPEGILIFTTQGESCLAQLGAYGPEFAAAERRYREAVSEEGACFAPYKGNTGYGIAILSRRYVEAQVRECFGDQLSLERMQERGWDAHQDVWSYRRVPIAPRTNLGDAVCSAD